MDRETWLTIVHGVAKSQTGLSNKHIRTGSFDSVWIISLFTWEYILNMQVNSRLTLRKKLWIQAEYSKQVFVQIRS